MGLRKHHYKQTSRGGGIPVELVQILEDDPVATAEFSKFTGLLSSALSQHHLLGFEIATWNSITSTHFVRSDAS